YGSGKPGQIAEKFLRLAALPSGRCTLNEPANAGATDPLFDPLSPAFIRDPYPHYHRLRAQDPMHRSPLGFLVASRYGDVAQILREQGFGKDFSARILRRHGK